MRFIISSVSFLSKRNEYHFRIAIKSKEGSDGAYGNGIYGDGSGY